MTRTTTYQDRMPVWFNVFPNVSVHCTRSIKDGKWYVAGFTWDENVECQTWREHRAARGMTPWLRFIRAFGRVAVEHAIGNPFVGDDDSKLFIAYEGSPFGSQQGKLYYAEIYLMGSDPAFKVGLDNHVEHEAVIEAFKNTAWVDQATRVVDMCEEAYLAVQRGYELEEAGESPTL